MCLQISTSGTKNMLQVPGVKWAEGRKGCSSPSNL